MRLDLIFKWYVTEIMVCILKFDFLKRAREPWSFYRFLLIRTVCISISTDTILVKMPKQIKYEIGLSHILLILKKNLKSVLYTFRYELMLKIGIMGHICAIIVLADCFVWFELGLPQHVFMENKVEFDCWWTCLTLS
jgi:hypothetical protein